MFCVSEDEATTIRAAFEQEGELSAEIELRRLFPGITDGARGCGERLLHRPDRLAGGAW